MVYAVRVPFGGVAAQDPRVIHTCMGREREKLARVTSALLASCMADAMAELVELVSSSGWTEGKQGEDHREGGKSEGMLMSCSPRLVMTVKLGSCIRPYTVYAWQSEARAGERVS